MATKEDDVITTLFVANTHTPLLFFTTTGMVYKLKTWRLPLGGRTAKGKAIVNILPIPTGVSIAAIMPVDRDEADWDELQIVFATSAGDVRRNQLSDFTNVKANGKIAMRLPEGVRLVNARIASESDDVMLVTALGRAIRFPVTDVRVFKGRDSTGVRGVRLAAGDELVSMSVEAVGRGNQHYGQGQWEPAKQAFGEALSTEKGDKGEQHYLRALCAQQLRQHKEALRDLNASLEKQPRNPQALFARGVSYRELREGGVAGLKKALADRYERRRIDGPPGSRRPG